MSAEKKNPDSRDKPGFSSRSGTEPPAEHRFKPGQSGNPGGRSKGLAEIRAEYLPKVPAILTALFTTALQKRGTTVGVAAAKEFLDRVVGKAPQPIVGEEGAPPVGVNVPGLVEALRRYVGEPSGEEEKEEEAGVEVVDLTKERGDE